MPSLNWIGKEIITTHVNDVNTHVLNEQYTYPSGEKSPNMVIHGDNLIALKALLPQYEGRIDCVYIDPPYNTGEEKWKYNDNVNDPRIQRWLKEALKGESVGKEGEDLTRHDKWLCMMYPRLKLLGMLLKESGTMAISIGYHELSALVFLCKELFANKQVVVVTVQTSGGKPSDGFNYVQEYIVFVAPKSFNPNPSEAAMNEYSSPYHGMNLATFNQVNRPNQVYPIYVDRNTGALHSVGKSLQQLIDEGLYSGEKADFQFDYSSPDGVAAIWPVTSKGDPCAWRLTPDSFLADWNKGFVKISPVTSKSNKSLNEYSIQYLAEGIKLKIQSGELATYRISNRAEIPTLEVEEYKTGGVNITTLWTDKQYYTTRGSNELTEIFGKKGQFPYPKPMKLIRDILQRITDKNSLVLDSFAGSGTTAHAVLSLNKADGGNRHFILIEMMEYAEDTTAERVRRVISGYSANKEEEVELYSKKITMQALNDVPAILKDIDDVKRSNEANYDFIGKPVIKDNCIKVIAQKHYEEFVDGIGGNYTFYELGEPLFKGDLLNENVNEDKIREYVFYSETKHPLIRSHIPGEYILDTFNNVGYYFYYKPKEVTVLSIDTLSIVTEKAENYVIYADICNLPESYMAKHNIVFKQIPRDIKQF